MTTGGGGNVAFTTPAFAIPAGKPFVTATATDLTTGDTSEFSSCRALLIVNPASLPTGTVNAPYAATFTAQNAIGTVSFAHTSGALPPSLMLAADGQLSGTPSQPGVFNFRITATDQVGSTGFSDYSVQINCPPVTFASLPGGTAGLFYDQSVTASPTDGSYSFAQTGTLPPGLSFNPATRRLSGTPTTIGTFNFKITATAFGSCMSERNHALTIVCPTITFNPASLPNAAVNTAYPATISATPVGTTYSFALTNGLLPAGLTLNSDGTFSGAPWRNWRELQPDGERRAR